MKVSLERQGRNALARLIGLLFPAKKISPQELRREFEQGRIRKILFVRPHQGLGDLLLATPVFRALQNSSPSPELHFLADSYNEVAIRDNPRLNRLWIWDKKAMKRLGPVLALLKNLRREAYDVAIPLSSHIPSFTSFLLARASGARYVCAFDTTPFYDGANWSRQLAHIELQNAPETAPEWVKFMEFARALGCAEGDFTPEFTSRADDIAAAQAAWRALSAPDGKLKIGLFLAGNPDRPERLWPARYWRDLIRRLQAMPEVWPVAIVPPPGLRSGSFVPEPGIYDEITPQLPRPLPSFAGPTLSRVAAFLRSLDLFVCVDGGLFHVAVASHVPTLGLFFVTIPERWAPPVPWVQVLRPSDDLPASLPPDRVVEKITAMLSIAPSTAKHLA